MVMDGHDMARLTEMLELYTKEATWHIAVGNAVVVMMGRKKVTIGGDDGFDANTGAISYGLF